MSKMVLLDGKLTPAELVTPDKARFIGTWRPPTNPITDIVNKHACEVLCSCGATLRYSHQSEEHYRLGCCDLPQYVSLERAP